MPMFVPAVAADAVPMQQFQAPESKNYAADSAAQAGGILTKQGEFITKVVENYKNDVSTAKTKERDTQAADQINNVLLNPENGYMGKMGKNAVDAHADTIKALDEIYTKGGEDLTDPVEQAMYKKAVSARITAAKSQVMGHTLQQGKAWRLQSTNDRMNMAAQTAIASSIDPTSDTYKTAVLDVKREAAEAAALAGMDKDSTALHVQESLTKMHSEAIAGMLASDHGKQAREYYDAAIKNKEILPSAMAKLGTMVKAGEAWQVGMSATDNAWQTVMGDVNDPNTPVKTADLFEALRKDPALKDNKEAYNAAKEELHLRVSTWNQQQSELNQDAENDAWSRLGKGQTLAQVMSSPKWSNMGGESQGRFRNTYESIQAARAARSASAASRNLAQMEITDKLLFRQHAADFMRDSSPSALAAQTREQIIAKTALYGNDATQHLLAKWDQVNKPFDGMSVISTDRVLKLNAQNAGILPKTGKPNEDQATAYNTFEIEIAKRVKDFERLHKKKATEQDLQTVIDGTILDKVKIDKLGWKDPEVLTYAATPKQLQTAYVDVDGQQVYIAAIPPSQRSLISSSLERNGRPVTEQAIARYWVKAGRPK